MAIASAFLLNLNLIFSKRRINIQHRKNIVHSFILILKAPSKGKVSKLLKSIAITSEKLSLVLVVFTIIR